MQKKTRATDRVEALERASALYGTNFASPHEGYAVMLEELGELFEEIKKKHPDKDRMREEAIRVGAMALKFIQSLEKWPWLGLKMRSNPFQCLACRYRVLTAEDRTTLGGDPCLTCDPESSHGEQEWDRCDDCGRWVKLNCDEDFFLEEKGEIPKMVCEACYETKYKEKSREND